MKNVRRYLKGSLVAKAIPDDVELKAHLDKQMDEHYGATPFPRDYMVEDTFDDGLLAKATIAENIVSAVADGRVNVDMVNLPPHYAQFAIEPIRFAQENNLDFLQGNIIKYLVRWKAKNGLEDLAKAKRCLEMYIRHAQGNPDWWKRNAQQA